MNSRILHSMLALAMIAIAVPPLRAQLVRETNPQAPQDKEAKPQPAAEQMPLGKRRISQEIQLTGEQLWSDTGIDVLPGEHIVVTATGKLRYADAKEDNGPDGITRGFKDLLRILPFNAAGRGALIGRVGDAEVAQPFLLGASNDVTVPVGGRLSIAINQSKTDPGDGSYTVRIDILAADTNSVTTFAVARTVTALTGIDDLLFAQIPRRVDDKAGNPGDMVNFLILGSQTDMQGVFAAAGWVKVDSDLQDTILHGLISSLSKES